jgi:K+ potassium transporter
MPLDLFIASLSRPDAPIRVPGTAVYLTTPSALALNLKHNGVLHKQLLLLKVTTERAPRVSDAARVTVEKLSAGIQWVELRFGFAEKPDVPIALRAHAEEIGCDPTTASFFVGGRYRFPRCGRRCPCGRNGSTPSWSAMRSARRTTSSSRRSELLNSGPGSRFELSAVTYSQRPAVSRPSRPYLSSRPDPAAEVAGKRLANGACRVTDLVRLISKVNFGVRICCDIPGATAAADCRLPVGTAEISPATTAETMVGSAGICRATGRSPTLSTSMTPMPCGSVTGEQTRSCASIPKPRRSNPFLYPTATPTCGSLLVAKARFGGRIRGRQALHDQK